MTIDIRYGIVCSQSSSDNLYFNYVFWGWKDYLCLCRVLHLTDIHLDLTYTVGNEADCGLPMCCGNSSGLVDIDNVDIVET